MAEAKTQFKINKLAKDMGLKGKDLVDLLAAKGKEVTAQKTLEPIEFDLLLDALTKENQISDIGDYLDGKTYIPSKLPQKEPKKEEPTEAAKEPPKEAPKAAPAEAVKPAAPTPTPKSSAAPAPAARPQGAAPAGTARPTAPTKQGATGSTVYGNRPQVPRSLIKQFLLCEFYTVLG